MLRAHLDWTNVGPVLATSTMHFQGFTPDDADAVAFKIESMWDNAKEYFSTSTTLRVRPEIEVVNEGTGEITDVRAVTTTNLPGTNVSIPVPQAAQVLLQMTTGVRYRSRIIRGRLYIPGFGSNGSGGGEVGTAAQQNIAQAAEGLFAGIGTNPVIWTRPREVLGVPAVPGFTTTVENFSVWREFAILRSRRS